MYRISDTQIDYILSDIRARGVEMEDLQYNLLDHVCCIIENNLEENGNFENFYHATIKTFYKDALWEIEEETISLLTFKNYYVMKKIMIVSGVFSALTMILGISFKFMHWPGASLFLFLGITSGSLVFIPLVFTLKAKEKQSAKDKLVLAIGGLAAVLISLSILFKVMHYPYANLMSYISLAIMLGLYLPIYFFSGIRRPETRVNTITSSVLIILGCGLLLTLVRTPRSSLMIDIKNTRNFIRSQQILKTEERQLIALFKNDTTRLVSKDLSSKINKSCETLKMYIVEQETGVSEIAEDFEMRNVFLRDHSYGSNPFLENEQANKEFHNLTKLIDEYNFGIVRSNIYKIPVKDSFVQYFSKNPSYFGSISTLSLLDQLTQIQMFVLQNQRELIASK